MKKATIAAGICALLAQSTQAVEKDHFLSMSTDRYIAAAYVPVQEYTLKRVRYGSYNKHISEESCREGLVERAPHAEVIADYEFHSWAGGPLGWSTFCWGTALVPKQPKSSD